MLKRLLLITLLFATVKIARCATIDTAVLYYKNVPNGLYDGISAGAVRVYNTTDYDFVRVIYSAPPPSKGYVINDFYKGGKPKLIGMATPRLLATDGSVTFDGECITYFENGKRQSILHYKDGVKDGDEYLFYPSGKIYAMKKHVATGPVMQDILFWECYDKDGTEICKEGAGKWINYEASFRNIVLQGNVKKGAKDGDWDGSTMKADSVKYIYHYKHGYLIGATSFDKHGKSYDFKDDIMPAQYPNGVFAFVHTIFDYLKLPKNANGKKESVDTVIVTFIIEKDGSLTHLETLKPVTPELKKAIDNAFAKTQKWTPRKYFGIPVKAQQTFSLDYRTHDANGQPVESVNYVEKQIDDE